MAMYNRCRVHAPGIGIWPATALFRARRRRSGADFGTPASTRPSARGCPAGPSGHSHRRQDKSQEASPTRNPHELSHEVEVVMTDEMQTRDSIAPAATGIADPAPLG